MVSTPLRFKMNNKQLLDHSIHHKQIPRIPTMYRGDPATNQKLLKYFGLKDIKNQWKELIQLIGADNFSGGEVLGTFHSYVPKYTGPEFDAIYDPNHFFIWGIKPVRIKVAGTNEVVYHKNPPLYDTGRTDELKSYRFPSPDWFDYTVFKIVSEAIGEDLLDQEEIKANDLESSDEHFLSLYCINCVFMTSMYMRGFDKMLMDLILNKRYSENLIGKIGEVMVEICRRGLKSIGKMIDIYGIWDDFATQDGLMISVDLWRRYYKPWTKKLVNEAKKYNLLVCFHICGSCVEIIPDLIEMGVEILDPVQVSAKNMELSNLKKLFGKNICFHGGIDGQKLIPLGSPKQIKEEVNRIKDIYMDGSGGIIMGPSHHITPDTPIKNILAIYKSEGD